MSQVAGGWGTPGGRITYWGLGTSTSELPENQGSLIPVAPAASGGHRVEPNIKFKCNQSCHHCGILGEKTKSPQPNHEKTPEYPKLRDILQNP